MPFEKVETQADFPALERAVLALWDRVGAFDRLREKNRNGPRWSFLDGPITANNPMGVHHAWGRTYKDAYQRYHAMLGQHLRYQNGFDCQGLWVEVEVEKELKLQSKRDIENLVPGDRDASVAKFVQLCKDRVDRFARVQTDQSIRLGYWMDWDRTDADWKKSPDDRKSYFTMSEENNYTIWSFLKKCHDRGLVYRGYDSMPWCGRCGVGISEQEIKEGYKDVEHRAVFLKLPLLDRPGENLLVWTTTPWTLTSNVGAAVNPKKTYLKVLLKGEVYYVAKGAFRLNRMESGGDEEGEPGASAPGGKRKRAWLDGVPHLKSIEQMFKEKAGKDGYEVLGEVLGETLLGLRYAGPFDDLPAQQHPGGFPAEVAHVALQQKWAGAVSAAAAHQVIDGGEDVTEGEGTGIVHTAPGCGAIDFQWGKDNQLPPVAPLDESGDFVEGFGPLTGRNAADPATADVVFEHLKTTGRLFATERYVHRYPHCWRCKTELLYRLVDEWFIHMGPRNTEEGYRGEIMRVVDQVDFKPPEISGRARERDWLWNMGDWMISKKRFWGLALPIWVDDKDPTQFEVIGSREELKARAVEGWQELEGHSPHRPYVDRVKVRNPKTGNLMSRIPDVGNPWLDAGIVPYSTMGYNRDRKLWEEWFPADFITESFPGQFRNWFYAILTMSTMMENRAPMKVLLGHGLVRDQKGEEMHKGKGNSIEFNGAADSGYELFVERNPKLSVEAQAKKELPEGHSKPYEDTILIDGKPKVVVKEKYPPMGADVIRWLYCRQAPASNVNIGPGPSDDLRRLFILKVWNTYSFFCNYARIDGFDPSAAEVPVAKRSDLDRWVLANLQQLVRTARKAFDEYNVMAFCLEAERFVDDVLSNWYVRRNKEPFQKAEKDEAKWGAYQTLYTVLVTLSKLFAPVIPFLSETMYQNLVVNTHPAGSVAVSVHLCDYPTADESLIDQGLLDDMDALRRLVTLGLSARNVAKIKVRQPLAGLVVYSKADADRRAVERFSDQITDELNVKQVTLSDAPLLTREAKLNTRHQGKFGAHIKDVSAAIAAADASDLAAKVQAGQPFRLGDFDLAPDDVVIGVRAAEGFAGVEDRGTEAALDTRLTEALQQEGMARDVIRQVQDLRKKTGLQMEDRITLYLATADESLRRAIEVQWAYIAGETLATKRTESPLDGTTTAKIEGKELTIGLTKA